MRDEPSSAESLRLLPGFARLPPRLIEKLARGMLIEQVPARTVLIREGRTPNALYLLVAGMLQQFAGAAADETTFAVIVAPALVQPHALYRNTVASASFRTVRASCVGRIAMPYARRLLADEPQFAAMIADYTVAELERIFGEYKSARSRNGLQRLAAWIVAMQLHLGAGGKITLPYDKTLLAARLGVAPATLSRDFAALERYGVTVCGRTLTIDDPDRLRALAGINPLNIPPVP